MQTGLRFAVRAGGRYIADDLISFDELTFIHNWVDGGEGGFEMVVVDREGSDVGDFS